MYTVFNNLFWEDEIVKKGYFTIRNFIPQLKIEELTSFFYGANLENQSAFTISNWSSDLVYRESVFNKIRSQLEPYLVFFNKYKPVLGVYTAKYPSPSSQMELHQDWSLVDESLYRSVSIWVALCDMDKTNGNLQVVEGSHLYGNQPRGVNLPVPFQKIKQEIKLELMNLPLKAGDAVIFDHRLIHASPENKSNKIRLAAVLALIPKEASLIHYYKPLESENEVELLELGEEDFRQMNFFDMPNRPKHLRLIEKRCVMFKEISVEEVFKAKK